MEDILLNQDILILFGTQTGTAEDLAEQLSDELKNNNISHRVENMFDISLKNIREHQYILILVSTWGDGDPPDDAEGLYQELSAASADELAHTEFAVFGLGDSGYEHFCQCGIDFDNLMELAGSSRLLKRVDADIDFDDYFANWAKKIHFLIHEKLALFV